ncbi:DUF7312 domain-containing protein [Natrinema caseinilyticum]|uniref:DUF7312 domain-containing protein n=1 Tax=Natrinema caseinilyticum TaxID=2961570 RepID=UPI0020C3FB6D|nr:hypothetical protein [Natrinema caseinilyticum]
MADDPSGAGGEPDDRRRDAWGADPDRGSTADSESADAPGGEGTWNGNVRPDRTDANDRGDTETADGTRDGLPLDLSGSSDDGTGADPSLEDEYTPEANSTPIEPGDPDLENALFVLLGAIAMVLVLLRLITIPLG